MAPAPLASAEFSVRGHSKDWDRLRELLGKAQRSGPGALTEQELWDLPSLYRRAISDLSLLRNGHRDPHLEQELTQICNAAHGLIYRRTAKSGAVNMWQHVACDLPAAVQRNRGFVWLAALAMTLFAVLGYLHAAVNPRLAESVLGPRMSAGIQTSLEAAREQGDLGLAAQIKPRERIAAWLQITLNNWGVSFRAALFGIAGGLITFIIVAFNGYMLGVIAYIYMYTSPGIDINLPLYFWAGIAPHGSIELPAITIAGAAGMLHGLTWLFPGQRPRGEALRYALADFWKLVQVCLLTLIAAGLIEGFVTPLYAPKGVPFEVWAWGKIAFGCVVFGLWCVWLSNGTRAAGRPKSAPAARIPT
jgi:uncharacterized membrane protein SpoIIM required for sporulation